MLFLASITIAQTTQPQLQAPWRGTATITQGNDGQRSHTVCRQEGSKRELDPYNCLWENTYAIDIALNYQPVLAPASGVVTYASDNISPLGGRQMAVTHTGPSGAEFITVYMHLSRIMVYSGPVRQGDVIAISGRSSGGSETGTGPHLHFHIWNRQGSRDSHTQATENLILRQVNVDPSFRQYDARNFDLYHDFVAQQSFESNNGNCGNGVSTYTVGSNPPRHPAGTFVKVPDDPTVYLLQGPDETSSVVYLRAISSGDVLFNPYRPECPGGQFQFRDIITISYDELFSYDIGDDLTTPRTLPCNGRANQDGKLIMRPGGGEIAVVSNGRRRPFSSEAMFVALGYPAYQFCTVVQDPTYDSYPIGPDR
jgi:murein DD-endopeptidase MepM/ murein hydrolase activator NlpD